MQRVFKDFTVALKMFNVFNEKQMYSSVITGKENACKNYNCILLMLMSFNVSVLCLVMPVLCVCVLRQLYGFLCEGRLATLC